MKTIPESDYRHRLQLAIMRAENEGFHFLAYAFTYLLQQVEQPVRLKP